MFDLLQQAVDSAIASGAKYSDARILSSKSRSIQARNGDIEDFNESESVGIGIRALVGSSWGFYSTYDLSNKSLINSGNYDLKFFIDSSDKLFGRTLYGIPIFHPDSIQKRIFNVDEIYIAISSIDNKKRRKIFEKYEKLGIKLLQVPSLEDIASGVFKIDTLRPIDIEDILGRDSIPPLSELIEKGIYENTICVTGAGGSIGSELCKQILRRKPAKLILLEFSEVNLYNIKQYIEKCSFKEIEIFYVLGNVIDKKLLVNIFSEHNIDIVFHAAAYKHVPLVEFNAIAGMKNNIISTKVLCELAREYKVRKFVLVSTDKAVRPTNIMGASKRISELLLQACAQEYQYSNLDSKTIFSIVRFGNVLGSSGSVVPKFKEQIENGGPITLTDERIIRYFMTIKEAVELVLQSANLSSGGDLFLLDMGKPILIRDLAEQMIKISGLTLKNKKNPDGDIEIVNTGLRPGEKLYEELLIDSTAEKTIHPRIFRAKEKNIFYADFWPKLDLLINALYENDKDKVFKYTKEMIPEWDYKNTF